MTFRTLTAPVALAALLASLWGCVGKTTPPAPVAQNPLAAGNAAFEQKNYAQACQELLGAGGGAETQTRAATACFRDGQAKAQQAFTAALASDPHYAPALEGLGLAAFAAGDLSRAREMLEAGARAGGKNSQAALVLGQVYLLGGQCSPAISTFQEALRRDPGLSAARSRLEMARLLCAAKGSPASAGQSASHAAPGVSGAPATGGSLSGGTPAAGAKEAPKAKPAGKTIDLNDI